MSDVENPSDKEDTQMQSSATDLLTLIKNDSGQPKYASIEEALKSVAHSQTHIATLESEARQKDQAISEYESKVRELTERVQTLEAASDYLKRIDMSNTNTEQSQEKDQSQAVDETTIASLIQKHLAEAESKKNRQDNLNKVMATLSTNHGDSVGKVLQDGMKAYGFNEQQVQELASNNPSAFLKLFDIKPAPTTQLKSTIISPLPNQSDGSELPKAKGKSMKDQVAYVRELRSAIGKKYGITS
jgi:DNA repair exonuclease SbcCD ATPase subunit